MNEQALAAVVAQLTDMGLVLEDNQATADLASKLEALIGPANRGGRPRKARFPLTDNQLANVAERIHVIAMETDEEITAVAAASVLVGMAAINNAKGG